jgi:iron complex transport system ATP-binding protein
MVTEAFIQINNAAFGYLKGREKRVVFEAAEIEIRTGEVTGLIGLNGSGKSTFLRSISGLQAPLSGQFRLKAKDLLALSKQELAKHLAVVLTEKVGGFNLCVADVVRSAQMPYTGFFNKLTAAQELVVEQAIVKCGVNAYADQDIQTLSDGMFQKTMIARALAQQTDCILLDEPSAYLDYASRHQLFQLLQNLAREDQKAVVISSHDLDLMLRYCTRLLIIDEGQMRQLSTDVARQDKGFQRLTGNFL